MGIAVDTSVPANVYVTDAVTNLISTVNSSTAAVTPFSGWGNHSGSTEGFGATPSSVLQIGTAPEFDSPAGIALGTAGNPTAGNAFVADRDNNTIRMVPITATTPPTSTVTTSTYAGKAGAHGLENGLLIGSAQFNGPAGVAVDATGNIYVADSDNNVIRELFPLPSTAGATTPALTGPAFSNPTGVAVDTFTGSGNIYVADSGHNAIQVISGTTVTTMSPGTTFSSPFGVAVDAGGNVYVADTFNNLVKKVTIAAPATYPVTGTSVSLPGSYNHPFGVAVDPTSGKVYVADTYNNAIEVVSGGVFSTLAGSATGLPGFADGAGALALFNHPNGVAVDPATGNVYVSDTYNQAVRMVTPSGTVVTLAGVGTLGSIVPGPLPGQLAFPFGIAVDPFLTTDGSGNSNPNGSLIISVNDALLTSPY
jgi:DNA-binding beta-propeller fold protein YncE